MHHELFLLERTQNDHYLFSHARYLVNRARWLEHLINQSIQLL